MQEAVISSPWMVPQNHLSFSKASISRLNPAAGTLPAFYLLPERASENTSKINMSFRPWFSLTTGHGMTIKLSTSRSLTGSKATRWTETCRKSRLRTTPKARVERLWLNEWLWVHTQDCPLQQPWISWSSVLDLQKEMIFTGTIYRDSEREI